MVRSWNSPLRPRGRAALPRARGSGETPSETPSNTSTIASPILSVTELCEAITLQLEASSLVRAVTVRGEVVDPRVYRGHTYFTLRDAQSAFDCIRWASVLGDPLVPGRLYDITGTVELWSVKGQIRLITTRAREVDAGERARALAELTERLRADGMFDARRKRSLPRWPSRIGVATSAEGAVIHDLTSVIGKRMPLAQIVLAPCPVQGVGASARIVAAIQALVRAQVDVIIVARGGGSAEDLAAYNDEAVVRAVRAASDEASIPTISAVGHETDTTLCDHAADVRAPTPSAAGEMVVPDASAVFGALLSTRARLTQAIERRVATRGRDINAVERRLSLAWRTLAGRVEARLDAIDRAVMERVPRRLEGVAMTVAALEDRARTAVEARIARTEARVATSDAALRMLSPLRVLERGYAIIEVVPPGLTPQQLGGTGLTPQPPFPTREGGLYPDDAHAETRTVGSVTDLAPRDVVRLRLKDGFAVAVISSVDGPSPERAR